MNREQREEIRARAEAATKGPWRVGARREADHDRWHVPIVYDCPVAEDETVEDDLATVNYLTGGFQYPHGDAKADAEFIAHARTDVPALLDEIDRLNAALTAARRAKRGLFARLIASAHLLDVAFTNAPEQSPWTKLKPDMHALSAALRDAEGSAEGGTSKDSGGAS